MTNIHKKHARIYFLLLCVLSVLLLLSYTKLSTRPQYLPPLPGTYQYFKETDFHSKSHRLGAVSHCDTRFALDRALNEDEVKKTLKALLGSYAVTMRQLGVETWIAHGTLLGWHWNQKLLPWDTDIDVQIPHQDLVRLATNYNMTVFQHHSLGTDSVRSFLLDVNPHHSIVSPEDVANKIDGRWIDRTNGKFIDITALHQDEKDTVRRDVTSLFCKDGHRYNNQDIYPLTLSQIEGIEVKVPARSNRILLEEYGPEALTNTRFHWYKYNHASRLWEFE